MKRLLLSLLAPGIMLAALILAGVQGCDGPEDYPGRNPWTDVKAAEGKDTFHFALVADRTGLARHGVFSRAVQQLNLLRPAFVLSVGDLIEGYSDDPAKLAEQWNEFEADVRKLTMPFFFVPGNHDLASRQQQKTWRQRFGRTHYHFVYRDVLFLVLNTADPPGCGGGLSRRQIAFVRKALQDNARVRWTIVALHHPLWDDDDADSNGWRDVEYLLQDRPYTVFAGHVHSYRKFVRHGRNYYQLATTGGASDLRGVRHGEFDHIVWVTMEKSGPVVANVLLDGVLSDDPTLAGRR